MGDEITNLTDEELAEILDECINYTEIQRFFDRRAHREDVSLDGAAQKKCRGCG